MNAEEILKQLPPGFAVKIDDASLVIAGYGYEISIANYTDDMMFPLVQAAIDKVRDTAMEWMRLGSVVAGMSADELDEYITTTEGESQGNDNGHERLTRVHALLSQREKWGTTDPKLVARFEQMAPE